MVQNECNQSFVELCQILSDMLLMKQGSTPHSLLSWPRLALQADDTDPGARDRYKLKVFMYDFELNETQVYRRLPFQVLNM